MYILSRPRLRRPASPIAIALVLALYALTGLALATSPTAGSPTAALSTARPSAPLSTRMDGKLWLIKDNDLTVLGGIGKYQWIGCGLTTAPLVKVNYSPCHKGQDPIYASYWKFAHAIRSGKLPAGSTAIFRQRNLDLHAEV